MRRSSCVFTAALLAVILCGSISSAQVTTGNILGTVIDTSGAVVPNAKVTITNAGTLLVRTMETGASGDYAFNLVEPGSYALALPDGIMGDNTYGAITPTATNASPRQFQLGLKLLF